MSDPLLLTPAAPTGGPLRLAFAAHGLPPSEDGQPPRAALSARLLRDDGLHVASVTVGSLSNLSLLSEIGTMAQRLWYAAVGMAEAAAAFGVQTVGDLPDAVDIEAMVAAAILGADVEAYVSVDTSDIPEVGEDWFARARQRHGHEVAALRPMKEAADGRS